MTLFFVTALDVKDFGGFSGSLSDSVDGGSALPSSFLVLPRVFITLAGRPLWEAGLEGISVIDVKLFRGQR